MAASEYTIPTEEELYRKIYGEHPVIEVPTAEGMRTRREEFVRLSVTREIRYILEAIWNKPDELESRCVFDTTVKWEILEEVVDKLQAYGFEVDQSPYPGFTRLIIKW